jgi:hypothetical protein
MEESDVKMEESEDIKEEIPEAITISPRKPEPEVSGVCALVSNVSCFQDHLLPQKVK